MIHTTRACLVVGRRLFPARANPAFQPAQTSPPPPPLRAQGLLPITPERRNATRSDGTDSQRPSGQHAPDSSKTIPGPSWLWLEPVYEPFRAYGRAQRRRPYFTQLCSSLVIYFCGDLVAQKIDPQEKAPTAEDLERSVEEWESRGWAQDWIDGRDWTRTGRALMIGGLAAVPGYKWFLWLSNSFNYSSKVLSLTTKVVVNQLLFTPIFNSYFFGMQSLLTGATFSEIVERIKNTVPRSWINSCKVWPAITAFSFTYIPLEYRSIFGGVIAIGWQTYLSLLNQWAAAEEKVMHMHEVDADDKAGAGEQSQASVGREKQGAT